jgi:hypothetical protein
LLNDFKRQALDRGLLKASIDSKYAEYTQNPKVSNVVDVSVNRATCILIKGIILRSGESASDHVPALLLGLGADAWPTVLLVRKQILRAFDVSDDVGASSLKGLGTSHHSFLDIDSTFNFQSFGAFGVDVEIVESGLGLNFEIVGLWAEIVESEGGQDGDDGCNCEALHDRFIMFINRDILNEIHRV